MYFTNTILAAALAFGAVSASAAPVPDADRSALQTVAAEADAAWNAKDAAAMSGQYVEDGSVRVGAGSARVEGREAVRAYFAAAFARRPAGFRHVTRIEGIEMIEPDVALAETLVRVERTGAAGGWELVREFKTDSLLVRDKGVWRMRAVRANPIPAS